MNNSDKKLIIGTLVTLCVFGGMLGKVLVTPGDISAPFAGGFVVIGMLLSIFVQRVQNVMHNAGKTPNREVRK